MSELQMTWPFNKQSILNAPFLTTKNQTNGSQRSNLLREHIVLDGMHIISHTLQIAFLHPIVPSHIDLYIIVANVKSNYYLTLSHLHALSQNRSRWIVRLFATLIAARSLYSPDTFTCAASFGTIALHEASDAEWITNESCYRTTDHIHVPTGIATTNWCSKLPFFRLCFLPS